MDLTNYRPSPGVLAHIKQVDFVAVVGPTAVGKTTVIKAAAERAPKYLHGLVASTSRDSRAGEQEGVDFHFAGKDTIFRRAAEGEYVTVATGATGDVYATAPEDYPSGKTALVAVLAHAVADFRKLPYRSFRTIFILPPDYLIWQQRLKRHGFEPEQLRRRLLEAEQSLIFGLEDQAALFVINGDVAKATEDFLTLARGGHLDERQQANQPRGRALAGTLLEELRSALAKAHSD